MKVGDDRHDADHRLRGQALQVFLDAVSGRADQEELGAERVGGSPFC
ncbi:hypothetical protein ACXX9E_29495 [Pseudomonas sp. GNP014]